MRNKTILFSALLASCVVFMGASELKRSEHALAVYTVTADEVTPIYVNNPVTLNSTFPQLRQYNEICFRNMCTDSTTFVHISTFSHVDEDGSSWPIAGTEKECHDWTGNIPLYVFRDDADATDCQVKVLFVR